MYLLTFNDLGILKIKSTAPYSAGCGLGVDDREQTESSPPGNEGRDRLNRKKKKARREGTERE